MRLQLRLDVVSTQQRQKPGVVLVDKCADRRRRGEGAFRDFRLYTEFFFQLIRLQRQCMHQIAHIQNRRAHLLDGFGYVARLEIHQRYPGIFNHRGADAVSGVVDLIWHAFISTRLEILRPCWRCLFSLFLFIAMSTL